MDRPRGSAPWQGPERRRQEDRDDTDEPPGTRSKISPIVLRAELWVLECPSLRLVLRRFADGRVD